jgi:hypothetical protein
VHRGTYILDMLGYAWAGIYRSLLVGSIVTTSYRNKGHIRAGDRIFGTGDFFRGGFLLRRGSAEFAELIRIVNLRHRVAGVVVTDGDGVRVRDGYEADYAYVATSFVEAIRRGLAAHERFRDAYDRHLRARPVSPRVRRMAQEIAHRIVPLTAAMADETVLGHVRRHLDGEPASHSSAKASRSTRCT